MKPSADRTLAIKKFVSGTDPRNCLTMEARLHDLGQGAYFAMTYVEYERGRDVAGGSGNQIIAKNFPGQAKYLKWHLVSVNKGPMHYTGNALYWAGCSGFVDGKPNSPPNWMNFLETIVWGGSPMDTREAMAQLEMAFESRDAKTIKVMLQARLVSLMDAFDRDMNELFGEGTITKRG